MATAPDSENLFLDGPAGRLEAILETPTEGEIVGAAVICHPHPQHGGTMHNKVAHTLARSFVRLGYRVLRFNFRGTEASDGSYDEGVGELDDALAAIDWLQKGSGACRSGWPVFHLVQQSAFAPQRFARLTDWSVLRLQFTVSPMA